MTNGLTYRGIPYEKKSVFVTYMTGQKEKIQREECEKKHDLKRLQQHHEVVL
jgi:hypothetical protein